LTMEAELKICEPTPFRGRVRKPPWLVKRYPDKPWKYPVERHGVTVMVYNFPFNHLRSPREDQEAIDWIDCQREDALEVKEAIS